MALQDMQAELRGSVPKLPFAFSRVLINRAYKTVRESSLWSFNLFESAWISPPPVNVGTATVVQGSTSVQFDATALAALNAASTLYSLITQRQFRAGSPGGVAGIYNIITFDTGSGIATLDRMYADPSLTSGAYNVYQLYYPAPMSDFLTWLSVRNMQMFLDLGLDMTRWELDVRDPQRSWYQFPSEVVPLSTDQRAGSATFGYPMFELWGQPVTPFTYQCYGVRRGVDLVNPGDTLPPAIGEDLVLSKAREYAYEWAEANKDMSPRSTGPDFRFLIGKAQESYKDSLVRYRKQDREFVNNYFSIHGLRTRGGFYYNTLAGVAGPHASF